MPRGDKSSYTSRQKRQAEDIEDSYERKGVSKAESERRAWATVNKISGGGLKTKSASKKTASGKTAAKKTAVGKSAAAKSSAKRVSATAKTTRVRAKSKRRAASVVAEYRPS